MRGIRLTSEERRRLIVAAAVPLFARKGFAGTTTKEIAEAAGVSEGLVYKHFPSKSALYAEIIGAGCQADPRLEHLMSMTPSTATLIDMVHYMLRYAMLEATAGSDLETRQRLMLNSLLEDGEYARLAFDWLATDILPRVEECLSAAEAAGDLIVLPTRFGVRFWLGHHLAIMLASVRLSKRGIVPYLTDTETLIADAAHFILRGLGIKDEVVAAHRVAEFPATAEAAQ
jgi:AcrR family transcriptional regulator